MADYIEIKSSGIYARNWVYDEAKEEGDYMTTPIEKSVFALLREWTTQVELEEGLTFKQLIKNLVDLDREGLSIIEMTANCNIEPFLHELDEDPRKSDSDWNLKEILIEKYYELDNITKYAKDDMKKLYEDQKVKLIISDFVGACGKAHTADEHGCNSWGLEFSHWGSFANVPLRISPVATVSLDNRKDQEGTYFPEVCECETTITLGEFLTGLFNEVCFCGNPKTRDGRMGELRERMDEVQSGTAKLIPWEDVKHDLETKLFNQDPEDPVS